MPLREESKNPPKAFILRMLYLESGALIAMQKGI